MRTQTVTNLSGQTRNINIRPLTRSEIKQLKECGYTCFGINVERETLDKTMESSVETVLSPEDLAFLDDCPVIEYRRCWIAINKETYGDKDEEKNSSSTSGGIGTGSESSTAPCAENPETAPPEMPA